METCFVGFFSKKNRQINNTKRSLNVRLRSTCDIFNYGRDAWKKVILTLKVHGIMIQKPQFLRVDDTSP